MLKQIIAVTSINLGSIRSRIGMSLVIVISIAAVVGVLLSLLALRAGIDQSVAGNLRADQAMLVDAKSGQGVGDFTTAQIPVIGDLPGVAHDAHGNPMIRTSVESQLSVTRKGSGDLADTQIIGNSFMSSEMDPHFQLIAGRLFQPGLHELIVGKLAAQQYENLDVGDHVHMNGTDWLIVGAFTDGGSTSEGDLWGDTATVMSATKQTTFGQVAVQLESAADFPRFEQALTANPSLKLDAQRETDWARNQMREFDNLLSGIGFFVAGIMAIGAVSAALNVMYAAVDQRKIEIATLRAIGFSGAAVACSVMIETILVALPGACIGALVAYLLYNGHVTTTVGLIFHLAITLALVKLAFIWTLAISLIAGLPPAIHAARLPVATAIRAN
jgi:putative ABC transport system permease protein